MRAALDQFDYLALLKKAKMNHAVSSDELKFAALSMQVAHITFDQLNEFTKAYVGSMPSDTPYADTSRKLFDGLLHEFEFRRDVLKISTQQR
jgi:hypothetical protein